MREETREWGEETERRRERNRFGRAQMNNARALYGAFRQKSEETRKNEKQKKNGRKNGNKNGATVPRTVVSRARANGGSGGLLSRRNDEAPTFLAATFSERTRNENARRAGHVTRDRRVGSAQGRTTTDGERRGRGVFSRWR